jgi:hypothetical protein
VDPKTPETGDFRIGSLAPRGLVDYAIYVAVALLGPLSWWSLVDATGEAEAWDSSAYWPAGAGLCFVLGVAFGSSRLPHVDTGRIPLVGFFIAALLFATHILSSIFTTENPANAALFPMLVVFWLPLFTVFAGSTATIGVVLNRGAQVLGRRLWLAVSVRER